jgi:NADH-quinone oxidoreductase subunit C
MEGELISNNLKEKFRSAILEISTRNSKRSTVTIHPDSLLQVAGYLYRESGFRFIIASAIHTRKGFEILYHFSKDQTGMVLNIHVVLGSEKPCIQSLSNMFNASNWIEREMHELFGIDFINHPNQEKLLSDGNWADGIYPYRKVFK